MTDDALQAAWGATQNLLPDRWRLGPATFDPVTRQWTVVARSRKPKDRRRTPMYVEGHGETEMAALVDLAGRLRDR
jgi:hypothetical protein